MHSVAFPMNISNCVRKKLKQNMKLLKNMNILQPLNVRSSHKNEFKFNQNIFLVYSYVQEYSNDVPVECTLLLLSVWVNPPCQQHLNITHSDFNTRNIMIFLDDRIVLWDYLVNLLRSKMKMMGNIIFLAFLILLKQGKQYITVWDKINFYQEICFQTRPFL